jgi:hypothetical protein
LYAPQRVAKQRTAIERLHLQVAKSHFLFTNLIIFSSNKNLAVIFFCSMLQFVTTVCCLAFVNLRLSFSVYLSSVCVSTKSIQMAVYLGLNAEI